MVPPEFNECSGNPVAIIYAYFSLGRRHPLKTHCINVHLFTVHIYCFYLKMLKTVFAFGCGSSGSPFYSVAVYRGLTISPLGFI